MPYCSNCGTEHNEADKFCSNCGENLNEAFSEKPEQALSEQDAELNGTDPNTTRQSMFYIGAILGVLGVLFLPFFFFLVALPEALLQMFWGRSVLDSLSSDASENPAMQGTFLIFRWFGNFIILVIVLAVIFVILLAIASAF